MFTPNTHKFDLSRVTDKSPQLISNDSRELKKVSAPQDTNHKTTTTALENSCPMIPNLTRRDVKRRTHHRTGLDYALETTLSNGSIKFSHSQFNKWGKVTFRTQSWKSMYENNKT